MNMSMSMGTSVRWWPAPNDEPVSTRCCRKSAGSSETFVPAGHTPTTTAVPPRCVESTACSIVAWVPTSSNAKSTPPLPLIACTRATGSSVAALTTWVAPNSSAHASFCGITSTAMILPAPTSLAAWIVLSPTPPQPHTATLAPGGTLARLNTGPAPASTPQETRHTTSSGASLRMGMTLSSMRTECVAKPATCR